MKKKILFILSLSLILSACQKEEYVSKRHPEANNKSQVETNVKYKEKDKSNDLSDAGLKKENSSDENKEANIANNETQNTENNENTTNQENVEGTFTVENITNMRQNTTTDSEIVAKLQPGNTVTRTEVDGEWSKVTFESYEGYILTELLLPAN